MKKTTIKTIRQLEGSPNSETSEPTMPLLGVTPIVNPGSPFQPQIGVIGA